jgi:hypothetical protein
MALSHDLIMTRAQQTHPYKRSEYAHRGQQGARASHYGARTSEEPRNL